MGYSSEYIHLPGVFLFMDILFEQRIITMDLYELLSYQIYIFN